jgi:hypothetical protein
MVWRELDIMFLGDPELSPAGVLAAMGRLVLLPGIVRFDYADERGPAAPVGNVATSGITWPRPTPVRAVRGGLI